MKTKTAFAVSAAVAASAAFASNFDNLNSLVDLKFAEEYAFSTNRAALVETLRPGTEAHYFFSALTADTEGRLDDAEAILKRWDEHQGVGKGDLYTQLRLRVLFHRYDANRAAGKSPKEALGYRNLRGDCYAYFGIEPITDRKIEAVKPNTYPAELDQKKISFDEFLRRSTTYDGAYTDTVDRYRYVLFDSSLDCAKNLKFDPNWDLRPDAPGVFDAYCAYYKADDKRFFRSTDLVSSRLSLPQLAELAKRLSGLKNDVTGNADYAKTVLKKLSPGADENENDPAVRRAWLERILAFSKTLKPSLSSIRALALYNLLDLGRETGAAPDKALLVEYLSFPRNADSVPLRLSRKWDESSKPRASLSAGYTDCAAVLVPPRGDMALVRELLGELVDAGDDLSAFKDLVEDVELKRIVAERKLLSGVPAAEVATDVFSEGEYKALISRAELKWSAANPKRFAPDARVALSLAVKNVPSMRVAIYDIDPLAACRQCGGEVSADLDLNGCTPTFERTVKYGQPSAVRHVEKFVFPELDKPGLYIVECSGNGIASRAVIRKGSLRVIAAPCAGGTMFTALDESGKALKDISVHVGDSVFTAGKDEDYAVVPFAPTPETAGSKTAYVRAGRLASSCEFRNGTEGYELSVNWAVPPETLVSGTDAVLLALPKLRCTGNGFEVDPSLVKAAKLTLTLIDNDGTESVRTTELGALAGDAVVHSFRVPDRFAALRAAMTGTVRNGTTGKDDEVSAETEIAGPGASEVAGAIEQVFLRRSSDGYRLELRGLNGEPLPARVVNVSFRHRVFKNNIDFTLQTDDAGAIKLGKLADIVSLTAKATDTRTWNISEDSVCNLPGALNAAEGETFRIPASGLFTGAWPGADKLESRVSLLAVNARGETTRDCISNVKAENGVLEIAGLPAGDYELSLRGTAERRRLRVTKAPEVNQDVGAIVGAARGLSDSGDPRISRIAGVKTENGKLAIRLVDAPASAKVHIFARRFVPDSSFGPDAIDIYAGACPDDAGDTVWTWCDDSCAYLSGRALGDKLRYIMERRNSPHRPGVMLDRPSLILNPWSSSETVTKEHNVRAGEDWKDPVAESMRGGAAARKPGGARYNDGNGFRGARNTATFDFLPTAAVVCANLAPDANGVVEVDLAKLAGCSDFAAVLVDGSHSETLRFTSALTDIKPRDRRLHSDEKLAGACIVSREATLLEKLSAKPDNAAGDRSKAYATIGEVFELFQSLGADGKFGEFSFVTKWNTFNEEKKNALYGDHACHELDFFLFRHDPEFFKKTVLPHLRNKRLPDFVDRYLLGENLEAWASPARIDELNPFEKVLLADRRRDLAPAVAREFRDFCAAHPVSSAEEDNVFRTVLGIADVNAAVDVDVCLAECAADEMAIECDMLEEEPEGFKGKRLLGRAEPPPPDADFDGWSNQAAALPASAAPADGLRRRVGAAGGRERKANANAQTRFYRPPERTREWLETYYLDRKFGDAPAVSVNRFWRDCAAAIASAGVDGKKAGEVFLSPFFTDCDDGFSARMLALSFLDLPFESKPESAALMFRETVARAEGGETEVEPVMALRRYFDPDDRYTFSPDGEKIEKYVTGEFVAGRRYGQLSIFTNPSGRSRNLALSVRVPENSIPLNGRPSVESVSVRADPYDTLTETAYFYFPEATAEPSVAHPATAAERGAFCGGTDSFACKVVAEATTVDKTSWLYISQNGTDGEVLDFLGKANLADPNFKIELAAWRLRDKGFFEKATKVLADRGHYDRRFWRYALEHGDEARLAEMFDRMKTGIADKLGPWLETSLVSIDPEETSLFTHKEYWPIINARVHSFGDGGFIPNQQFSAEYRAFLDTLAYRKAPDARDRMLECVFLVAQDRIDEAKAQFALASPADAETAMQSDYLRAYFAFCDGAPEKARGFAEKYLKYPVKRWRDRFAAVVAQADEIKTGVMKESQSEGLVSGGGAGNADAPSVALASEGRGAVTLTACNVAACTLRAYPTDLETLFSKEPFGNPSGRAASFTCVRPVWEKTVKTGDSKPVKFELPAELRGKDLVLVAADPEERASATLSIQAGELDVQVLRERGELLVRDAKGKPVAGAYVKVYAKTSGGRAVAFHKDGYTDLRGRFAYAAVSTDLNATPEEFAVLVLDDKAGGKTITAPVP